jgi:hypothetical protein
MLFDHLVGEREQLVGYGKELKVPTFSIHFSMFLQNTLDKNKKPHQTSRFDEQIAREPCRNSISSV